MALPNPDHPEPLTSRWKVIPGNIDDGEGGTVDGYRIVLEDDETFRVAELKKTAAHRVVREHNATLA